MKPGDRVKQTFPPNDRERFGTVLTYPFQENGQTYVRVRFEEANVSYGLLVSDVTELDKI
jgi:hypothetical protein